MATISPQPLFLLENFAYRTFRVGFNADETRIFIGLHPGILRFSVILKGWTKRVGKKSQTPCKYGLKWYFIFPGNELFSRKLFYEREVRCRYCGFYIQIWKNTGRNTTLEVPRMWECSLPINRDARRISVCFFDWLFSKDTQKDMTGEEARSERKTAKFWDIWAHFRRD